MISNHSASIYSLAMNARYKMIDFQKVKRYKKLGCIYSVGECHNFKKIYIDTELSQVFRFERWIGDIYYCIEAPIVSYALHKDKRVKSFNVDFKITVCEDNIYTEYAGSINDDNNFPTKKGRWTETYMLEYGYSVFIFYAELIIKALLTKDFRQRYFRIYEEGFLIESL